MREDGPAAGTSRGSALSCDSTTLDDAQRKRWALLRKWLQVGTCEVMERPDGYAFWLDPDCLISQHVEEFISLEQRCCPFLRLRVQTDAEHGGPVLVLAGDEVAKEFVAAQFGIGDHTG